MYSSLPLGSTISRDITVHICKLCGCEIGPDSEGCDYNCVHDFEHLDNRPAGSVVIRRYRQNNVLIAEEPYIPKLSADNLELDHA